ncbi:MAG: oligopeptide/dipeptide ABC transporter ATP-binding protein [Candidatus Bathyarchaeia archaeon]|jgi:oligopeptide/dipeptide ABC transporter ATP-binding protein
MLVAREEMSNIVEVNNLTVSFIVRGGNLLLFERGSGMMNVVNDVTFNVREGETFGLAGETGSGKSIIAWVLVGLFKPRAGSVKLLGKEINFRKKTDVTYLRRNVGIVFQDPVGSLNPRLRVKDIIKEGLVAAKTFDRRDYDSRIEETIDLVGLRKSCLDAYPKELSGGEKQRVSLARAIAVPRKMLVLDEPTSSLDVSVQAQVLNTLKELKSKLHLSYFFITHDINVMKYMSDSLGILYYGKLLEVGPTYDVVTNPKHPFTVRLMSNVPGVTRAGLPQVEDGGERGSSATGCVYSKVCPHVFERCSNSPPSFASGPEHFASCFLLDKNS